MFQDALRLTDWLTEGSIDLRWLLMFVAIFISDDLVTCLKAFLVVFSLLFYKHGHQNFTKIEILDPPIPYQRIMRTSWLCSLHWGLQLIMIASSPQTNLQKHVWRSWFQAIINYCRLHFTVNCLCTFETKTEILWGMINLKQSSFLISLLYCVILVVHHYGNRIISFLSASSAWKCFAKARKYFRGRSLSGSLHASKSLARMVISIIINNEEV